jgi:predicted  nucleic acid-binding Zn-ribbon protein
MNTRKFYFCHTAKLSALLGGLVLLNGCSSAPKPQIAEVPNGLSAQEFHDTMAEFERMKPSLQRLAALEPELKALIAQLNQIAQAAEAQEKIDEDTRLQAEEKVESSAQTAKSNKINPMTDKVAKAPQNAKRSITTQGSDEAENVNDSAPAPIQIKPPMGQYTLQLSAVTDKNKLLTSWRTLQKSYSPELNNRQAIYQEVVLSGVTYYRIKAGFYSTEKLAKQGCSTLKKLGANCIVSNSSGLNVI